MTPMTSPPHPFFTLLSPTARNNNVKCVAGESLRISLEGINVQDATLVFTGYSGNHTLVSVGRAAQRFCDVPSQARKEKSAGVH